MTEVGSVRMRNVQVLGCESGKVDEQGGKQVSNSCGFPSFLNSDKLAPQARPPANAGLCV